MKTAENRPVVIKTAFFPKLHAMNYRPFFLPNVYRYRYAVRARESSRWFFLCLLFYVFVRLKPRIGGCYFEIDRCVHAYIVINCIPFHSFLSDRKRVYLFAKFLCPTRPRRSFIATTLKIDRSLDRYKCPLRLYPRRILFFNLDT